MIPALTALPALAKRFWPLAVAALFVGLLLLAYCRGEDAREAEADRSRLEGNVKTLEKKATADTKAADTRVINEVRAEKERAELKEATDTATDPASAPTAYRRCVRLQQAARAGGLAPPSCS
jgi:hypothetical protein